LLVRLLSGLPRTRERRDIAVPPLLTGMFERLLAFTLFYLGNDNAFAVLGLWIGAKLAANWQRRSIEGLVAEKGRAVRVYTLIALMAGILSVGIGAVAGSLARSHPEWWSLVCGNTLHLGLSRT
jgi:small-conductance mechanosensitive channel